MKMLSWSMLAISVIAANAAPAMAQNFISNSAFDTDTSGWTGSGSVWIADDCCGNAASGSVRLREYQALESNCISATPSSPYDLTLWSKFAPLITPPLSYGSARVIWSTDATCTDVIDFPNAPRISMGTNAGWQRVGATFLAPANAHSVLVELVVSSCGLSCGGYNFFDDVAFGPAGTVPVQLQSFGID